ncbi:MAG: hypothetical protein PHP50_14330 [Lachnospiraceae bacterium]|nr:hypothetical protein [Lachnospiraceae bacterium]
MENLRNILIAAMAGLVMILIVAVLGVNIRQSRQLASATDHDRLKEQIAGILQSELKGAGEKAHNLSEEELEMLTESVTVGMEKRLGAGEKLDLETLTKGVKEDIMENGLSLSEKQSEALSTLIIQKLEEHYGEKLTDLKIFQESIRQEHFSFTETIKNNILSVTDQINSLVNTDTSLKTEIDQLRHWCDEKAKTLEEKINGIEKHQGEENNRLAAQVQENKSRLDAHDGKINSQEEKLKGQEERINAQEEKVNSCFQSVSSGKAMLASTLTDFAIPTDAASEFKVIDDHIRALYEKVKNDSYAEGASTGFGEGHTAGFNEGQAAGYESGYAAGYADGMAAQAPTDMKVEEIRHNHVDGCKGTITGVSVAHWTGPEGGIICTCQACNSWEEHCSTHFYWSNPDGTTSTWGLKFVCRDCDAVLNDDASFTGYYFKRGSNTVERPYSYTGYSCGYSEGEVIGYTITK